jgi:threonine-phosphate decarboxylase
VGNSSLLERIGETQPHWSVNALAMKAGVVCLEDTAHVAATQQFIRAEKKVVFQKLKNLGFEYSSSQINFYLLKDPALSNQKELFTYLLKHGIVLRHTENFPGIRGEWLRVTIKTTAENQMLMEALTSWKKEN